MEYVSSDVMATIPNFTYTGQYELTQSAGNWALKLLTSGVLTMSRAVRVDVFRLGGGGGGGSGDVWNQGGGGGGAGYTATTLKDTLTGNTGYQITVGAGGAAGLPGGDSSALGVTAAGGAAGAKGSSGGGGGSGGSGGGSGAYIDQNVSYTSSGNGGSDGSKGGTVHGSGGTGQGTGTREFGEASGGLCGGGGGGGSAVTSGYINGYYGARNSGANAPGGAPGGGSGGDRLGEGLAATANTGGGGGGGGCNKVGGAGGSGIVIVRNTRYGAASFISAQDGIFGAALTIILNRDSSSATHTITAKLLSPDAATVLHTETVAENTAVYPTISWTPSLAVYAPLITDRASAQFQLECVTCDEGSEIGTEQLTAPVTVSFRSEDAAPVMDGGAVSAAPYNTGAVAKIAGYVQGYSRAQVAFDDSAVTLKYGASIASYSISCGGVAVSAAPYQTQVLTGETEILCRVTDSRGFYAETALTVTPLSYQSPRLSGISIFRCGAQGTADEDGAGISARATVIYSALNNENSAALTAAVRLLTGSYGTAETIASGTATVLSPVTDPDLSYMVKLTATDALGNTAVYEQKIPLRKWALKFRPDGDGVAFGKAPAAAKTLEIPEDWEIVRGGEKLPWGELPDGGTAGQLLKKTADGTAWADDSGGVHIVKLWENASPTSSFSAQTVSLDLSGYDMARILYSAQCYTGSEVTGCSAVEVPVGMSAVLRSPFETAVSNYYLCTETRLAATSAAGVIFSDCYGSRMAGAPAVAVKRCIPLIIYGIKGVT